MEGKPNPKPPILVLRLARGMVTLLALLLAMLSVLSFIPAQHRLFDLIANLRMQGLIAIGVIWLVALTLRHRKAVFCLSMLLLANFWGARLAVTDGASQARLADELRVTSLNVYSGNSDYAAISDELRRCRADVMVIVELTPGLAEHLEREFKSSHPFHTLENGDHGNFGLGVLSNKPITDFKLLHWPDCPKSLAMTIGEYRLLATHPHPPVREHGFQTRNFQLANLAQWIADDAIQYPNLGIVCVGDFNLTPWSAVMLRFLELSGLHRAGTGLEISPTWFVRDTFALGLCIDHVLIGPKVQCQDYSVGEDCGSDHRSVTATLGHPAFE